MAFKRLSNSLDNVNKPERESLADLINFIKRQNVDVVQGAWWPDSIIKDNSTGHIWQYRVPNTEQEIKLAKLYSKEHHLPSTSASAKYVKDGSGKNDKLVLLEKNSALADRCQALVYAIRDELKIQEEVVFRQKDAGSPLVARNNQISLLFYMLSHYISDGHMPLHCDSRKFRDSIHSEMEKVWERDVLDSYELIPIPGVKNQRRFELDTNSFPVIKDRERLKNSVIGQAIDGLNKRKFSSYKGRGNSNTWDYMVDVCFYSYLISEKILPLSIREPKSLQLKEFRAKYMRDFKEASVAILSDAIESLARIWLNTWKDYKKLK